MILKTSKKVYEVMFLDMSKYVYSESLFNTPYIEMKQNVKKISSQQNKRYKKCTLFSTRHSFTFDLKFWYELKYRVCLCKSMCGIFHFRFYFVFIKVYFFVKQKA